MAKILIVDDETQILQLMHKFLRSAGHDCRLAENAVQARYLLETDRFDLMLSDINMPGESGVDLVRHVKSACAEMGVVMASVIDDPAEARKVLELGVYGYIVKPFTKNVVLICVENALRRRELELCNQAHQQHLELKVRERTAELEKANALLRNREEKILTQMKELKDLNSALRVLLKKREEDRRALEESVMANARSFIAPCLQRLKKKARFPGIQREVSLLEAGVDDLISPFVKRLSMDHLGLTPNEIRVATLIKQGMTTKEIAEALNLSTNTIMTHRFKIRTKLGIKNKQQSLHTFLKSLP